MSYSFYDEKNFKKQITDTHATFWGLGYFGNWPVYERIIQDHCD